MAYKPWTSDNYTQDASANKVKSVFEFEAQQRALAGIVNRVGMGTAGTGVLGAGLLIGTHGTAAGAIATGKAISYTIDGVIYALDVTVNVNVPAVVESPNEVGVISGNRSIQPIGTFCKYLVSVGTDGTAAATAGGIAITQGNIAETAVTAMLPDLPVNSCALGYFQVQSTSVAYTPGTTSHSSAGNTFTYVDLVHMPTNR